MFKKLLITLLLLASLNGCVSLGATFIKGAHPYCGTRVIVGCVTAPFESPPKGQMDAGWFVLSLALCCDLWGTLAMDTLLLPFTCFSDYGGYSADGCP